MNRGMDLDLIPQVVEKEEECWGFSDKPHLKRKSLGCAYSTIVSSGVMFVPEGLSRSDQEGEVTRMPSKFHLLAFSKHNLACTPG